MQQLMRMLEDKPSPDWLEVAELHRELGEPDKALECLGYAGGKDQDMVRMHQGLIDLAPEKRTL